MKKFMVLMAAFYLVVGGLVSPSFAACRNDQKLKLVGTTQTGDATIATGGHDVAQIVVACGSSACTATLADPDADPGVGGDYGGDAFVVIEVGAPANQTTVLDLTSNPIKFDNVIEFNDDGNVAAVTVYECR